MEQTKKNILIVSRSFYPMNSPRSFRTTELAKEFARQGHQVKVITPREDGVHDEFEKEFGITIKDMGWPKSKEIEIKGTLPEKFIRRGIKRFSDLLFLYPKMQYKNLVNNALKGEEGYDLLVSIAVPYPVHFGVAKIRSKEYPIAKTWVADCGDPFMGAENDSFKYPFYFKYWEKWFCRKADYLSVPTTGSIQAYYPEFHDKIKVIPQGFKFEEFPHQNGKPSNARPRFAYAGALIPGRRDPSEFLDYLVNLDADFEFHIYTSQTQMIKPYLKSGGDRIKLNSTIPRNELLHELTNMDFLVNFENVGSKQTPSKLIEYAVLGKPILSVKYGNLKPETIDRFLKGNYEDSFQVENLEQYRIDNVCRQFLDLAD